MEKCWSVVKWPERGMGVLTLAVQPAEESGGLATRGHNAQCTMVETIASTQLPSRIWRNGWPRAVHFSMCAFCLPQLSRTSKGAECCQPARPCAFACKSRSWAARARCCTCAVLRVRGAARAAEGALESHHLHLLLELIRVIIVARRHRVPVVAMEVDERATLGREIHVRVIDGLRVLAHLPTPRDG